MPRSPESQPAEVAAWWGTLTTDQQTASVLGTPAGKEATYIPLAGIGGGQ